jgi:quercetin dioxygenase-like cupin family protein
VVQPEMHEVALSNSTTSCYGHVMNRFLKLCLLMFTTMGFVAFAASPDARVRSVVTQPLPQMDGSHLQVTAVEVTYPPGGSSTPHSHPCPVIGYVLRGAVRMQVKGDAVSVYRTGESFYEPPNGVHLVSANASKRNPATFLATFICDHAAPLSSKVHP